MCTFAKGNDCRDTKIATRLNGTSTILNKKLTKTVAVILSTVGPPFKTFANSVQTEMLDIWSVGCKFAGMKAKMSFDVYIMFKLLTNFTFSF